MGHQRRIEVAGDEFGLGRELFRSPIVEDEEFDPAEGAQQLGPAPIAARAAKSRGTLDKRK